MVSWVKQQHYVSILCLRESNLCRRDDIKQSKKKVYPIYFQSQLTGTQLALSNHASQVVFVCFFVCLAGFIFSVHRGHSCLCTKELFLDGSGKQGKEFRSGMQSKPSYLLYLSLSLFPYFAISINVFLAELLLG